MAYHYAFDTPTRFFCQQTAATQAHTSVADSYVRKYVVYASKGVQGDRECTGDDVSVSHFEFWFYNVRS